jgi:hypothetical protein
MRPLEPATEIVDYGIRQRGGRIFGWLVWDRVQRRWLVRSAIEYLQKGYERDALKTRLKTEYSETFGFSPLIMLAISIAIQIALWVIERYFMDETKTWRTGT